MDSYYNGFLLLIEMEICHLHLNLHYGLPDFFIYVELLIKQSTKK